MGGCQGPWHAWETQVPLVEKQCHHLPYVQAAKPGSAVNGDGGICSSSTLPCFVRVCVGMRKGQAHCLQHPCAVLCSTCSQRANRATAGFRGKPRGGHQGGLQAAYLWCSNL